MSKAFEKYLRAEDRVHIAVCEYLKYTKTLWFHCPNESRRTPFERWLFKKLGGKAGIPDILIIHPTKKYCGMALELKADGVVVYKKNGEPRSNMIGQHLVLKEFEKKGWYSVFGIGTNDAIDKIQRFLKS